VNRRHGQRRHRHSKVTPISRERVALTEVLEQVQQMKTDVLILALGLACIEDEVADALARVGRS
jgi:hypothetical protein